MGLRDLVTETGASDLMVAIDEEFEDVLANATGPFGEDIEGLADVSKSVRKYDYGQASNQTVQQFGVRATFDSSEVAPSDLSEGGRIYERLSELASQHLKYDVEEIDYMSSDDTVWIVIDIDVSEAIG